MGYEAGQGETAELAQEAKCLRPAGPGQNPAPTGFPSPVQALLLPPALCPAAPSPSPRPCPWPQPLFLSGLCPWGFSEKTQIHRALLLLSITTNLPQLLVGHSGLPHSPDLADFPSLISLFPAPSLHAFSTRGSLLREAVPDCPQVEAATSSSGHPSATANARCRWLCQLLLLLIIYSINIKHSLMA